LGTPTPYTQKCFNMSPALSVRDAWRLSVQKERQMKLLGWTIVAAGLALGLVAACTVTSEDPATTDGGTGGTGGGAAGTGGAAGLAGAAGSLAGAAGSLAGAAGSVAGAAGAAGAGSCTPADDSGEPCGVCMAKNCCKEQLACENDEGSSGDTGATWDDKCYEVWALALDCYDQGNADGGTITFDTCLGAVTTDNVPANDLYLCISADPCKSVCFQ
jgi:hypothetical protein